MHTPESLMLSVLPDKEESSRLSSELSNWSALHDAESNKLPFPSESPSLTTSLFSSLFWISSLSLRLPVQSTISLSCSVDDKFSCVLVFHSFASLIAKQLSVHEVSDKCLVISQCLTLLCMMVAALRLFKNLRLSLKRLKAAWITLTALSSTASWNFSMSLLHAL